MKKSGRVRLISIIMVLALLLPMAALAETISTGSSSVPVYDAKNGNRLSYSVSVSGDYANEGGWYRLPGRDGSTVWISAADILAVGGTTGNVVGTPSAGPSASPTASDDGLGVIASPSPSASAAATSTYTAPPAAIDGAPDTSYEGTILNYTVGTNGLWLYSAVDGKASVSVKSGTKLTLTTPVLVMTQVEVEVANPAFDENDPNSDPTIKQMVNKEVPNASWASLYYSGKTYYVPVSSLSIQEESGKPDMNTRSVTIGENGADYYTGILSSGKVDTGTKSGHLEAGRRINVHYATNAGLAFAFTVSTNVGGATSTKTYYFDVADILANSGSSASIGSNADDTLLTQITIKTSLRLYRTPDFVDYLLVTADASAPISVYGTLVTDLANAKASQYYKVTYNGTVYYVKIADKNGSTPEATGSFTIKSNLKLYKDETFGEYELVQATAARPVTLNGEYVAEKQYYKVTYNGADYFVKVADKNAAAKEEGALDTESEDFDLNHVGYNEVVAEDTFWVTIGTDGGYYYTSATRNTTDKSLNAAGKLAAGRSLLASHYQGEWYKFVQDDYSRVYYLHSDSLAGSVSTNQMSSVKVKLKLNTELYSNMEDRVKSGDVLNTKQETADTQYYTLRPINNNWYSIVYNGKQFYVRAQDVQDGTSDPISTTTEGKTYWVTIGEAGGILYRDVGCTNAYMPLIAGQKVQAVRYSSALYTVEVAGGKFYLPVTYIASVLGGDDAATIDDSTTEEDIGVVIGGETDDSFNKTILNYTVPQGGLWLYSAYEPSPIAAMVINAGTKLQLTVAASVATGVESPDWYTTWYGGRQYYINKSAMGAANSSLNTTNTYSVQLNVNTLSQIQFYKNYTTAAGFTNPVSLPSAFSEALLTNCDGKNCAAGCPSDCTKGCTSECICPKGRINVRIAGFEPKSKASDPNVVAAYAVDYAGITYYFAPRNGSTNEAVVIEDSILLATVGSNLSTSLITKLVMEQTFTLNTSPESRTKNMITVTIPESGSVTLYGVSHNENWYRVVYDGKVRYLHKQEYDAYGSGHPEQLSVSDGAASSTYTVVIGNGGADTYSLPSTNTAVVKNQNGVVQYEIGEQNLIARKGIPAGTAVLASKYDATWYTCVFDGRTVYFRTTNIVNENANAAVSSRIITTTGPIPYYTTTTNNASIQSTLSLPAGTYTFRTIDSTWSSVFYGGKNVYVRNSSFTADEELGAIAVASTSVGKTYTITVGSNVVVYTSTEMSTKLASIEGGTKMSGTLMFIQKSTSDAGYLVYKVAYGGTTGYIYATDIVGVQAGDETTEGKVTEDEGATVGVGIGKTIYVNLNAGTVLYEKKDTTSTYTVIASTGAYELKKEDANWYSMTYNGATYYIPRTEVEVPVIEGDDNTGGSSGGAEIPVNTTFFTTVRYVTNLYAEPTSTASIVGTLLPGIQIQVKKISESWYEYTSGTTTTYIRGSELFGAPVVDDGDGGTSGGITTDETGGIITSRIKIAAGAGTVNLRKQASTAASSTILERIPMNTVLTNEGYVRGEDGHLWYKVTYNNKTGYVIDTYVSAVGTVNGGGGSNADPSQDIGRTLTVAVSSVNIRNGAGTGHGIIGKLEKGAAVIPTSYATGTDGMTWYSFIYSGTTTGWIRYDYLSGGIASTEELSGNVAIKAGDTNLRSGAGGAFGVLIKLPRDTIVTIIGSGTDSTNVLWYRVSVDGTSLTGYVRSDLVRQLTLEEQNKLQSAVVGSYSELRYGSTGEAVLNLQNQLIRIGYLAAGNADGTYGTKTTEAVKAFQTAHSLSATGVATAATQAAIFNTTVVSSGSTTTLDWFTSGGEALLQRYPNIQIYDIKSGVTWNATYINGANHADVVPASKADAQKLVAGGITGSYIRRPVIVTVNQTKYAASMYAVGHGTKSYVSYFSGVMCIHFTGSKTHESNKVDAEHQQAIQEALNYSKTYGQ